MKKFLITLFVWVNIAPTFAQEITLETAKPYLECVSSDHALHLIAELKGFKNFKIVNYKLRFEMEPLYTDKKLSNASLTTTFFTNFNNETKKQFIFEANNIRHFIYLFHKGRIRREKLILKSEDLKTAVGSFSFREGKGRYKQDFTFDLSCIFKSYE